MALIVTTEQERCLCTKQGVLTVPIEDAVVSCKGTAQGAVCKDVGCQGIDVDRLPLAAAPLQAHFYTMGAKFRDRYQIRGFEPVGSKLWLHGPFPSYDFNQHLVDVESALFRQAEYGDEDLTMPGRRDPRPDLVVPFVFERGAFNPYADYVFLGYFLGRETVTAVRQTEGTDRSSFQKLPMFTGGSA